jgi:large subunit ribosomal protein L22
LAGEEGIDLDVDNLYVKNAIANDGPRMKRIRPAPMGRAYRYQRRLTHIELSVAERHAASGLVTRAGEPATAPEPAKAAKAKKAAPAAQKKPAVKKHAEKMAAPKKTAKKKAE